MNKTIAHLLRPSDDPHHLSTNGFWFICSSHLLNHLYTPHLFELLRATIISIWTNKSSLFLFQPASPLYAPLLTLCLSWPPPLSAISPIWRFRWTLDLNSQQAEGVVVVGWLASCSGWGLHIGPLMHHDDEFALVTLGSQPESASFSRGSSISVQCIRSLTFEHLCVVRMSFSLSAFSLVNALLLHR